jgi:hypothetical protein
MRTLVSVFNTTIYSPPLIVFIKMALECEGLQTDFHGWAFLYLQMQIIFCLVFNYLIPFMHGGILLIHPIHGSNLMEFHLIGFLYLKL